MSKLVKHLVNLYQLGPVQTIDVIHVDNHFSENC